MLRKTPLALGLALFVSFASRTAAAQSAPGCSADDCNCEALFVRAGLFPTPEGTLAPDAVHGPAVSYDADGDGDQDALFAVGPGRGECALNQDDVQGDRGGQVLAMHEAGGYRAYLVFTQAQPSEHHGFSLLGTLATGGRAFAIVQHGESFDTEATNYYAVVWLDPGAGDNAFDETSRNVNESIAFEPGAGGTVLETATREPLRGEHVRTRSRYRLLTWDAGARRFNAGAWSARRPAVNTVAFPPVTAHGGPESQVAVCRQ